MSSKSNKPAKSNGCTPLSVSVAVLTPDDQRQINFGLTKGCNPDNSSFWIIDFILKVQKNGQFKTRVEVHVAVGEDKKPKAEKLAETKKLTQAKANLLQGRVADRAAELPPGTTRDPELEGLLTKVL